jgi:hypothetical protein
MNETQSAYTVFPGSGLDIARELAPEQRTPAWDC